MPWRVELMIVRSSVSAQRSASRQIRVGFTGHDIGNPWVSLGQGGFQNRFIPLKLHLVRILTRRLGPVQSTPRDIATRLIDHVTLPPLFNVVSFKSQSFFLHQSALFARNYVRITAYIYSECQAKKDDNAARTSQHSEWRDAVNTNLA